jgi:hypothetical protein
MKKVIALCAFAILGTSITSAKCPEAADLILNASNNAMPGYMATVNPMCIQDPCDPCKTVIRYVLNFKPECPPCVAQSVCSPCGM